MIRLRPDAPPIGGALATPPTPPPPRGVLSRLADLLVLLLGAASVLAVAEMAVRPFYPAPPELRSPQVTFRFSPRLGWEMAPAPAAWTLDRPAAINARGLRGADAGYVRADSAAARWLVLGGGTAFGTGVAADELFHALAARERREATGLPVEVINAACEGFDPYQSLLRFETEGVFYDPDLVILMFEPEDLPATGRRDTLFTPERFARVATRLNREPPRITGSWDRLRERSRLVHLLDGRVRAFLRLERRLPATPPGDGRGTGAGADAPVDAPAGSVRAIDILLGRETPALEAAWRTVEAELDRIGAAAARGGARVCVVVLPIPAQLRRTYPRARYQARLERICEERGFLFVDPLPGLREVRRQAGRLYLPRLPFLNARGHRLVADQLRRELETPLAHRSLRRPESPDE